MTSDADARGELAARLAGIAGAIVADGRWEPDDVSRAVAGLLLYGYALGEGRLALLLDGEAIDAAVRAALVERLGAGGAWSEGLVAAARAAAFDAAVHPGHHALIGAGHAWLGRGPDAEVLDNVFDNIAHVRGLRARGDRGVPGRDRGAAPPG